METTSEMARVEWLANTQRGEGVMAWHTDGRVIFPAHVGYTPPSDVADCETRAEAPIAGEVEQAVLVLSSNGKTWFAYPAVAAVETAGPTYRIEDHLVVLGSDLPVSVRWQGGKLIITIG